MSTEITFHNNRTYRSRLSYLDSQNKLRKDHLIRIKEMKHFFGLHIQGSNLQKFKVLDLGCSGGEILSKICNPRKNDIYGIDTVLEKVKLARSIGIKARVADLSKRIPFTDNSMNLVIAGELLEHLYAPERLLLDINRVLADGGGLIVTVPNICSFRNRLRILFGRFPKYYVSASQEKFGEHIRLFNAPTLIKLLSQTGFEVKPVSSNGIFGTGILSRIFYSQGEILVIYATKIIGGTKLCNHQK